MNAAIAPLLFLSALFPQDKAKPNASGGELIPEQAALDVRHYDLTLRVTPDTRSIEGRLTMTALALVDTSVVVLDLDPHLEVRHVTYGVDEVDYEFNDGRIRIPLGRKAKAGETMKVTVAYGGQPRVAPNPPWDGGFTWAATETGQPWIATTCQMNGADLWWPCKDHPSDKPETMDLRITVPDGLICASNGVLQSDEANPADGTRTFHWRLLNPISNYNVALNIAPYELLESSWQSVAGDKVPVYFWVLPESVEKAKLALPEFVRHMQFHESVVGPYAFRNEKYGIVETPHLGMEHQTIIAYGNKYRGKAGYDWLHHHESAHEWWANLVTCRDWKDMWIHEGFGTYMQSLYKERTGGKEGYMKEMAGQRRGIGNKYAVAPREATDSLQIYNGHDIYSKGSWILHTLRWLIGEDDFFESFRRFAYPTPELEKVTDGSQVRLVDTNDYLQCVEKYSGQDLDWFFDVYLHQPHLPELVVEEKQGQLELRWKSPGDLPFPMPVPVKISDEIERVSMKNGVGRIRIPTGKKFEVDPDHWLLKQ